MVGVGKSGQMRGVDLGMGARIYFRDAGANARGNLPILGGGMRIRGGVYNYWRPQSIVPSRSGLALALGLLTGPSLFPHCSLHGRSVDPIKISRRLSKRPR